MIKSNGIASKSETAGLLALRFNGRYQIKTVAMQAMAEAGAKLFWATIMHQAKV